ncbi:hypothetical protein CMQ_2140 [Grosmannia clavigera kw1407]|uniref:Uncharacterized protein n=1 Tax=Grosmannia clavigera (strain kw1407 / UAMH 11150) TaxID=655863 RepID=F0XIV6_GROCL|nr:uncharacterized protein CMQ_2140 [Grosmannia clavigera kw1407]EFX02091.1 hypothetical protein CMQ_2140 [Grosmannia clavigera kw1407]
MRVLLYTGLPDSLLTNTANTGDMHMPNLVGLRKLYFVPQAEAPPKMKKKPKMEVPAAFTWPPSYSGAHLKAVQSGHWTEALPEAGDGRGLLGASGPTVAPGTLRRAETWCGGQFLARYEKFDTDEDCNIVPQLGQPRIETMVQFEAR